MSTTLPHGIIQINEGNISWYGGITANWQLIDSKIGEYDAAIASIPAPANTGTLTINYGGTTIAMFGADDAGDVSADIPAPGDGTLTVTYGGSTLGSFSANQATPETIDIPAPGDGALTIRLNGSDVQTFTANASTNKTANIQCVDLSSNQTVAGNKEFTGTTTAHDLVPSATDTYNFGSPSYQWNNAYIKSLTINGVACGDILTHNVSEFMGVTGNQTISGEKTFIGRLTYKATSTIAGDGTSGNFAGSFNFIDKNNVQLGTLGLSVFNNNGYTEQALSIINPAWFNDDTKIKTFGVRFRVMHDTEEVSFTPTRNNTINLGTSTNKWKSIYSDTYYLGNTAFGNIVTHNASEFVQVSDLATVATSGSYNDLSNKPTIPTVNNGTLTIKVNGTTAGIFTANQATNEEININAGGDITYATDADMAEMAETWSI